MKLIADTQLFSLMPEGSFRYGTNPLRRSHLDLHQEIVQSSMASTELSTQPVALGSVV
jgi:hypothetical protein